jgi:two-component system sensor histidine kinase BarA
VRLSQILSNLVNNALKFTESGYVRISVSRESAGNGSASLRFAVEDTGIGISPDKIDHIFEAFSQADQSTTRRFGGTGLGLSICQRLVAAMGGRIRVESEPSKGSTFAFTLTAPVLEDSSPRNAGRGGSAIVAVEGAATRGVIESALLESVHSLATIESRAGADVAAADIVFAGPEWIEAYASQGSSNRAAIICVAGVGNGKADRLLQSERAAGLLTQPVSSARVREIVAAIEAGTLASLGSARRADAAAALPELKPLSVMVADDSAVNREVVTEALARLNALTHTVEDGKQAVEAYKSQAFDVVLMDCSMPDMDGFAATRAIRKFEAETGRNRTPIVALTAHAAGTAADSWRVAGMDDYLTKPFTIRSLAECLARWQPKRETAAQQQPPLVVPNADGMSAGGRADGPVLDPDVLESLRTISGGNDAMLARIFGLFRAHAPTRVLALKTALAIGDFELAASEAHALKSPSLNIGALKFGALCGRIEVQARAADNSLRSGETVARLQEGLEGVLAAIALEMPEPHHVAAIV